MRGRSSYSSDKSSSLFPIPEPILQSRNRSAVSHSATHRYSAQPDSLSTEQDSAKFSPQLSASADQVVSSSSRSELPLWQELIDSNLRSGTIACLWCLRTLFLRRVSRAFHRWRVNTLVPPSTSAGVVPQPTPEEENRDLLLRDYQTLIDKFGTVNQQHPSLQQAMSLLSRMRETDPTIGVTPGQISSSYSGMSSNTQYVGEELFFPWQQRASSHHGITSSGPPQSMSEQSYHGNHGNSVQPQWTQQPIMHQQMDYPQEPQHTSVYQNQQTLPPPPPQHQNNWSQPPLPPNNQQWNIPSSQPLQPLPQQWPPASQPGWQSQPVQQGHTAPYIATPTPQPVTEITPSASEAGQLSHLVRISHTLLDRNADPETKRQILLRMSLDILGRAAISKPSVSDSTPPRPSESQWRKLFGDAPTNIDLLPPSDEDYLMAAMNAANVSSIREYTRSGERIASTLPTSYTDEKSSSQPTEYYTSGRLSSSNASSGHHLNTSSAQLDNSISGRSVEPLIIPHSPFDKARHEIYGLGTSAQRIREYSSLNLSRDDPLSLPQRTQSPQRLSTQTASSSIRFRKDSSGHYVRSLLASPARVSGGKAEGQSSSPSRRGTSATRSRSGSTVSAGGMPGYLQPTTAFRKKATQPLTPMAWEKSISRSSSATRGRSASIGSTSRGLSQERTNRGAYQEKSNSSAIHSRGRSRVREWGDESHGHSITTSVRQTRSRTPELLPRRPPSSDRYDSTLDNSQFQSVRGRGNPNETVSHSYNTPSQQRSSSMGRGYTPEPYRSGDFGSTVRSTSRASSRTPSVASTVRRSAPGGMERAQHRLLYGDLEPQVDTNVAWQRSLRR